MLNANLTATLGTQQQVVNATLNFANEDMPFKVATDFNNSPLAPFFAFVPALKDYPITGVATGHVEFGGNICKGRRSRHPCLLERKPAGHRKLHAAQPPAPGHAANSVGNVEIAIQHPRDRL